jgi:hypothetical protein
MTEEEAEQQAQESADEAVRLLKQIRPLLAGKGPAIQSAVIADLLATWLLGFEVPGNETATAEVRSSHLSRHIQLVMDLVLSQCPS